MDGVLPFIDQKRKTQTDNEMLCYVQRNSRQQHSSEPMFKQDRKLLQCQADTDRFLDSYNKHTRTHATTTQETYLLNIN